MRELELRIDDDLSGKTVKELLFEKLFLASNLVTKLKSTKGILVNDECVTVRKVLQTGDVLKVVFADENSENIIPNNIPLDIIYEDEDLLVVNKPCNMPTHPSFKHYEGTLANAVMYYFRDTNFTFRAVNRLDRDTTGIVVIAKNQYSAGFLNKQIMNRDIKKTYLAICCGKLPKENDIIDAPIKREKESVIKRVVASDGQRAKTQYWVEDFQNGYSLVRLMPHTGRTHQIRVHMAHINTPIYGDFVYGKEIDGERVRLHCLSMEFRRPSDNKNILLKAPKPKDFFI